MTTALNTGPLKQTIRITLPQEAVQNEVISFLEQRSSRMKMDGFRPGKVPLSKIFERYGFEALKHVVLKHVESKSVALKEGHNLLRNVVYDIKTDLDHVSLDTIPEVEVEISAYYLPEISDVDLKAIVLPRYKVTVEEEEVEAALKERAEKTLTSKPLQEKRPARHGDTLKYTMVYDNGKGYSKNVDGVFQLGTGMLPKEFEDGLEGISDGFVLREKLKVPGNFPDEELAGKKVSFSITFHEILDTVPFEVGEDFAKHLGFENLEALKKETREKLEKANDDLVRFLEKRLASKRLMEHLSFDVEEDLLAPLCQAIKKSSPDKAEDEIRRQALGILRLEYWMKKIEKERNITSSKEELEAHIVLLAQRENVRPTQVAQYYQDNPSDLRKLDQSIIEQKILSWACSEMGRGEETVVNRKELDRLFEEASFA